MGTSKGERGHLMVGLMAAVAVMAIVSTVAFQAWADVMRRDREAEMIFRGQEIARALKKYQKAQGTYPTELKKLMDKLSTNQYVLRRLYQDPLVKGGKWGLLFLTPDGGVFDPNGEQEEGALDASGQPATGQPQKFGLNPSAAGSPSLSGVQGAGKGKGTSTFGSKLGGGGAQEGLPIVGVRTLCTDKPFRVFRDQTDYSKWLFTALDDDALPPAPGQPGQPKPPKPGGPGGPTAPKFPIGGVGGAGGGITPIGGSNPSKPDDKN